MYHAHYGMQREAGLYGSLRVALPDGEVEPFSYDHDRSIILNDWYHKSTYEQAAGLSSIPFVWVGDPQVFNGYNSHTRIQSHFHFSSIHEKLQNQFHFTFFIKSKS